MISADELKALELFQSFDDAELQRFARKAADVRVQPGEWLLREGEPPYFGVLLEGRVMLVKDILGTLRDLPEYSLEVGEFYGELPLLMGVGSVVSLRAETPCRVARFERQHFQRLVQSSDAARALILQKMNERLFRVQRIASELPAVRVVILGTEYDADCRDVRSFLAANRIPYDWVDREKEPHRVPACVPDNLRGPGVVIDGKSFLHPPSVREVARALNLETEPKAERYDVVIVGAGFALLTLTLVTGIFFSEQLFGKPLTFNHKTVFSVLAWFAYGALLVGRLRFGWRGRKALNWILFGSVMLLLAYLGSKFVLEVILGR